MVQILPSQLMNDVLSILNAQWQPIHGATVLKTLTFRHSPLWHDQQCAPAEGVSTDHRLTIH